MSIVDRWLLPDGIEEILPPHAARLEAVRRRLLDQFSLAGFELVITPMVEYLESLLTGTGSDLDLKTFKITDQVSGRTMGLRADITPQVARIDAHSLSSDSVTRLCYAGTVLHAKADNMLASRSPISVGAELFGDTEREGDLEIVSLMVESIRAEDVPLHVELGDVGIFRDLVRDADLSEGDQDELFGLIQRKATAELNAAVSALGLSTELAAAIDQLPALCGGIEVLGEARKLFAGQAGVLERLDNLSAVADGLASRFADLDLYFDLSELRGYAYHTGIVFAAYNGETGTRLAKGGRYDDVGSVFGRSRAATGFDLDLKALTTASRVNPPTEQRVGAPRGILIESGPTESGPTESGPTESSRWHYIQRLRREGYVVVEGETENCDLVIAFENGEWKLVEQGRG